MRVHGALCSRKAGNARGITVPREKSRWTYTVDIANCLKNNYFIDLL